MTPSRWTRDRLNLITYSRFGCDLSGEFIVERIYQLGVFPNPALSQITAQEGTPFMHVGAIKQALRLVDQDVIRADSVLAGGKSGVLHTGAEL